MDFEKEKVLSVNNTKKTIKIYWQHILKYKFQAAVIFITVTAATIQGQITPIFYKVFFDILAAGGPTAEVADKLIAILLMILGLQFAGWLLWRICTFTANYFQSRIMTDLTNHCYSYLFKHSFAFFNNSFVGSLVKKVKWFGRSFEVIMDRIIWNLFRLVIIVIVITAVLFNRNFYLGLSILIWTVLFLAVSVVFSHYKLRYDIKRAEAETKTTGFLADTITNNSTVKLFNGYRREVRGFAKVNDDLRRLRVFTWNLDSIYEAVQGFLMITFEIGIMYYAVTLWKKNLLTLGDFVLIQAYLMNIFDRIWDFGRIIRTMYEALADAEEMTVILDQPHEIADVLQAKKIIVSQGAIDFDNVSFYYHQTRPILEKFNFAIRPKEHVALIGPSGAGKTTIIRLLLRMHDIGAGRILIDGQDIAKVTQESLWANISLVPQDPILFHRSLKDNIRYGRPAATDSEVIAAAKAAHCHEFIAKTPDGYGTFVGERGIKLSGGERQRVAIARAILRGSPILVLDEATSSLDSESELLIQDALNRLMSGKTVIVIAHRLSTIRKMDRIIVIDEGGVIEEGTHDQLLKKGSGIYNRLWQLQAGGFIA